MARPQSFRSSAVDHSDDHQQILARLDEIQHAIQHRPDASQPSVDVNVPYRQEWGQDEWTRPSTSMDDVKASLSSIERRLASIERKLH